MRSRCPFKRDQGRTKHTCILTKRGANNISMFRRIAKRPFVDLISHGIDKKIPARRDAASDHDHVGISGGDGQAVSQLIGMVNEDRQMLGTDPERL